MDGHLLGNGSPFALAQLPVERMIAFVWWFFTREAEEAEKTKFEARLWRPDPEQLTSTQPIPAESPWSAEKEMAAFGALKAQTGS